MILLIYRILKKQTKQMKKYKEHTDDGCQMGSELWGWMKRD